MKLASNYTNNHVTRQQGTYNELWGGIEIQFSSGASYGVGDELFVSTVRTAANA